MVWICRKKKKWRDGQLGEVDRGRDGPNKKWVDVIREVMRECGVHGKMVIKKKKVADSTCME